jgi:hypothetical protein
LAKGSCHKKLVERKGLEDEIRNEQRENISPQKLIWLKEVSAQLSNRIYQLSRCLLMKVVNGLTSLERYSMSKIF